AAARAVGDDVREGLGAVERLAADPPLEVALLGRRELLVEEEQIDALGLGRARHLLDLAASDERGRVPALALLDDAAHHLRARAAREGSQLFDGGLGLEPALWPARHPDQEGFLGGNALREVSLGDGGSAFLLFRFYQDRAPSVAGTSAQSTVPAPRSRGAPSLRNTRLDRARRPGSPSTPPAAQVPTTPSA